MLGMEAALRTTTVACKEGHSTRKSPRGKVPATQPYHEGFANRNDLLGSVPIRTRPRRSLFLREARHEEQSLVFQIHDEKRRIAQKQARPEGLRGKCRHAALRNL